MLTIGVIFAATSGEMVADKKPAAVVFALKYIPPLVSDGDFFGKSGETIIIPAAPFVEAVLVLA